MPVDPKVKPMSQALDGSCMSAVQLAAETGVTVVMDCGGVEEPINQDLLQLVTVLSPNETELARLTGDWPASRELRPNAED